MRRLLWIALVGGLFVLLLAANTQLWWCVAAQVDERRGPDKTASRNDRSDQTLLVEVSPELARAGVTCVSGGPGEVSAEPPPQPEMVTFNVTLRTSATPLDGSEVGYTLLGPSGQLLSRGRLPFRPLAANGTRTLTVRDAELRNAARVILYR